MCFYTFLKIISCNRISPKCLSMLCCSHYWAIFFYIWSVSGPGIYPEFRILIPDQVWLGFGFRSGIKNVQLTYEYFKSPFDCILSVSYINANLYCILLAHDSCSLKQMQYTFAAIFGPLYIYIFSTCIRIMVVNARIRIWDLFLLG